MEAPQFKYACVILLDPKGSYDMYIIPHSYILPEELGWCDMLHEEGKTVMISFETKKLENHMLAQIQMNFMSKTSSTEEEKRALKKMQAIYREKWGADYKNVGKWNRFVQRVIEDVYILRSSYPIVYKNLTLE